MFGEFWMCIIIYFIGWCWENNIVVVWFIFKVGWYMIGIKGKSEFCFFKIINVLEGIEFIFFFRVNYFVFIFVVFFSCCFFSLVVFEMFF